METDDFSRRKLGTNQQYRDTTTIPGISLAHLRSRQGKFGIARDTYFYDPDALKFRSHTGWKQDNIWAACLGLTEEAKAFLWQSYRMVPTVFLPSGDRDMTGHPTTTGEVAA